MKKSSQKAVASKSSLNQSLILTLSCSLISSFFLLSCSGSYTKAVDQASQSITDSLGCANVQSKVFDAFYSMIDQDQLIPQAADLKLGKPKLARWCSVNWLDGGKAGQAAGAGHHWHGARP